MKRLNRIKNKECCEFLIKSFAIKNNGFEWLVSSNIKGCSLIKYFPIKFLDSKLGFSIAVRTIKM
ncbi:hypothetical protein OY14_04470 (plasmid) [Borreliella chilensis]|uniref:Uncharacterized protein n=1 Tax=Borreliella chilensis TaxID=1245910 RepID=A0A0A7UWV9_9SPIR|nr:hypothetical protein OY14_04470 [Borreliella chilensis]